MWPTTGASYHSAHFLTAAHDYCNQMYSINNAIQALNPNAKQKISTNMEKPFLVNINKPSVEITPPKCVYIPLS